jgi:hypothetical protein
MIFNTQCLVFLSVFGVGGVPAFALRGSYLFSLQRPHCVFDACLNADGESNPSKVVQRCDAPAVSFGHILRRPELVDPENVLAEDVFSDPFFYEDKENRPGDYVHALHRSRNMTDLRRSYFKHRTVLELSDSFTMEWMAAEAFRKVGIQGNDVFSPYVNAVEFALQGRVTPLNGFCETALTDQQFVDLDSKRRMLFVVGEGMEWRSKKILFVLGSKGCGKTYFSLKQASTFTGTLKETRFTTIYVKISELEQSSKVVDPQSLITWIQSELSRNHASYNPHQRLKTHVSLVLDDAGCPRFGDSLYIHETLRAIHDLMCEHVAESVRLIVCGNGVAPEEPVSKDIAVIRLGLWTPKDVVQVARARFRLSRASVVMIFDDPALAELTTNALSACHLLEELAPELCHLDMRLGMASAIQRLKGCVPEFTSVVVRKYISQTCLERLDPVVRRRLAAWVFYVADQARREKWKPYIPEYEGVFGELEDDAFDFLEWNLVNVDENPTLRDNRKPSVSVSPAIGMVLISTLGVSPTVWAGDVVQRTCACYALQQQAILAVAQYLKAFAEKHPDAEMELDSSLSMLALAQLRKRVPEPSASARTLSIPLLPGTTVWMNKRRAPFADVVAPFALYKCRAGAHRNGLAEFDILEELLKCGLLKPEVVQARLGHDSKRLKRAAFGTETLAAICAGWQGTLATEGSMVPLSIYQSSSRETNPIEHCDDVDYVAVSHVRELLSRKSMVDPTNFIDQVPVIRFVFMFHSVLVPNHRRRMDTWATLRAGSAWENMTVTESDGSTTGCLSDISLKLFEGWVNSDGTVNEDLVSPTQQSQWKALQDVLKEWVRENVEIRFCFYGTSLNKLEPEYYGWRGTFY